MVVGDHGCVVWTCDLMLGTLTGVLLWGQRGVQSWSQQNVAPISLVALPCCTSVMGGFGWVLYMVGFAKHVRSATILPSGAGREKQLCESQLNCTPTRTHCMGTGRDAGGGGGHNHQDNRQGVGICWGRGDGAPAPSHPCFYCATFPPLPSLLKPHFKTPSRGAPGDTSSVHVRQPPAHPNGILI